MTILVGYTESAASRAALNFGLELAAQLAQNVVVANACPVSEHNAESKSTPAESEEPEQYLARFDVPTELRQYSRVRSTVHQFKAVVADLTSYVVVSGAARPSASYKSMTGSVAAAIL